MPDSILEKGNELAVKAAADEEQVEVEGSMSTGGESWALKWWAKVKKPWKGEKEASAGVDFVKRWLK